MIALVGVIHLPPLPGSPRAVRRAGAMSRIVEGVQRDVAALARAKYDAVIIENFGDAPFEPGAVSPITIAAMTSCVRVAALAGRDGRLAVGVNVLRNDVRAALAIAAATETSFVRVNVHVGAVVSDQGIIEGRAHETMRERVAWGATNVKIWADVDVKHAAPLGQRPVEEVAKDAVLRGLADAVLVTGAATGAKVDGDTLARVRSATRAPIYVASGAVPEDLPRLRELGANGVIVGSHLRRGGKPGGPIDPARALSFAKSFRRAF